MRRLINRLPLTRIKLFLGRVLYRILHLIYREDIRVIVRHGIKYEVDLSEAIDFSVFLFGEFQGNVCRNKRISLPKDAIIFDVGANLGAMTLQYAKLAPLGKVYSFEPTHCAFSKLKKNLELNPELAKHVVAVQSFVSSKTSEETDIKAYASWKIKDAVGDIKHGIHGGVLKSAKGIGAVSLDDFCEENEIRRLDLIKIDTDGHEFEVLRGARKVIAEFRPIIVFEAALYLLEEKNIEFSDYSNFFGSLDYSLFNSSNFKEIDAKNYRKHIPSKGTIDILAIYRTGHKNN